MPPISVTVWCEDRHEEQDANVDEIYPDGIHNAIANSLDNRGYDVQTATLDEPEHGLSEDVLAETDVLIWWGHLYHDEVSDEVAERVQEHVLDGMGFIPLHSAQGSKPFTGLVGTTGDLSWRISDDGERERIWVVEPSHPIAEGIEDYIELEQTEMYGEHFDIPQPDTLVFISWFEGGEVFRSGCCYQRRNGRIFYFRPGHETFPHFRNEDVLDIIDNAVKWAACSDGAKVRYERTRTPPEEQ